MLDINFYKKSGFFTQITLLSWKMLFLEWEIDPNFYIIDSWEIYVLKNKNDKNEYKILSILYDNDIFWEWFLNDEKPKTISIKANKDTKLLKIDKIGIDLFSKKYPEKAIELYKSIIVSLNERLLILDTKINNLNLITDSNINKDLLKLDNHTKNRVEELDNYIISVYEIDRFISEITVFDNINLFKLINKFNQVINAQFILYIEKNEVVENYYTLKYDTRFPWKMFDDTLEIKDDNDLARILFLKKDQYIIQKISIFNKDTWYFVIWKELVFTFNEKKIINTITTLLAQVINQKTITEQKKILSEEQEFL